MPVYFLLTIVTGIVIGQDPCSDRVYSMLPDVSKRSPSFLEDSVPLCDKYIYKKWYRAGDFYQIPTTPPELISCGTLYPYWMDDSLPVSGGLSTVKMCRVGFDSNCERSHTIRMKNCGLYSVYELTPLDICNAAYCFERSTSCVDEVPSGVSVAYHNVSWETTGKKGSRFIKHEPTVNLICNFLPLSNTKLLYEVTWYIDNIEALRNQTVTVDNMNNAILSAKDILNSNKTAGSMIHCVVGAKQKATEHPCKFQSSIPFFAGIKVSSTRLDIPRGKSATISLEFTIPFADQIIMTGTRVFQTPKLAITLVRAERGLVACHNKNSVHMNQCETNIPGFTFKDRDKYATDEWKQQHKITIYNLDNGDYTINKHFTLRLETGGTQGNQSSPSKIFDHILLPDVQVQIVEPSSEWKGRYCISTTDPNLSTFDDLWYACQLLGTFILYRNELYNQEVQEKHFSCHPLVTCNCAVAVRSGRDIFTVDVCRGEKAIINFPLCDDKILKVRKQSDRVYKVVLPTGTIVEISIRTWNKVLILDVIVTASASDFKNSRGMCGILDGLPRNDFLGPDNVTTYDDSDSFSRSWLVNDNENLLIESNALYKGLKSISHTLMRVCNCSNATGEWKITCNYGTHIDCKFNTGKQFFCILNQEGSRRRKRDLTYLYSKALAEETSNFEPLKARRSKRQTMMSFVEAKNVCLTAFEKSVPFRNCQKYVSSLGNSSLSSCISDLRFTGDASFTAIHVEAALEQCSTFIALNSTFQEVEKDITHQIQSLCPSNCSGNGVCNKGNCTCNPRYAGSDCSFDLLGPPTITLISNFGFCDKSEEECDEITLYGRYFLEHMNTRCYTTRRRITENGSFVLVDYFQRNLEERTLFEGYCPLEYATTPTWVTFFTFNISNDGRNFTENYDVYTYQSLCQEFHNDSGKISVSFKEGYCFVDGRCIADGKSNPKNECDVCNVVKDKYSWTYNEGHCYINGRCIADGEVNLKNLCEVCNTTNNLSSWSISRDFCYINNVCYFDGERRENNVCEICSIKNNLNGWTFNEGSYCLIDGHCLKEGERDSQKECYLCNPELNKKAWSLDADGYCFINKSCVRNGEHAALHECKVCNPSSNNNDWSFDSDGYCFINETCVPDGEHAAQQECKVCNPSANNNDWSFDSAPDTHCFINGRCVPRGERDTHNECNMCNPALNKHDWSVESGCSTTTQKTTKKMTTTGSATTLTESLTSTTAAESTEFIEFTTTLAKPFESSKIPVSTVLEQTTMPTTNEMETSTTETKILESTATTHVKQETTIRVTTPTINAPVTEETTEIGLSTMELIKKESSNAETDPTTATIPTDSKTLTTKEIEQDIKEAKPKDVDIIEDKIAIETSSTFIEMTEQMSLPKTTQSLKTTSTAKTTTKQNQTDLPVKKMTAGPTTPDQLEEPTTRKDITNKVLIKSTEAPKSIETNMPTMFIQADKTTTVPKTRPTSQTPTKSTHSTTSAEDLTAITTCCDSTTNIHPEAEKANVVNQLTILAVSITGPAVFVLVIIAVVCGIHCYRRSHGSIMLNSG